VGPNICAKIPTTDAGLKAMEALIAEDTPLNATEIMGVSQGISICEMYLEASRKTGKTPTLFLSHIAGIYDEHLKNCVTRDTVDISPDLLCQGGLAATRKLYRILQERGYPGMIVGGGARALYHFTEMVGGDVVVTINWQGTADQLIEQNPPVVSRFFNPVPEMVLDELMEKLPDFKRGYLSNGLTVEEYEEFGPVELFRSSFVNAWQSVLDMMKERRGSM
jgi:transaldolase